MISAQLFAVAKPAGFTAKILSFCYDTNATEKIEPNLLAFQIISFYAAKAHQTENNK